MRRGGFRGGALLALLLLAAPLAARGQAPVPDVPTGPGNLRGRVLQAGDARPVSGVDVVLYALSPDGEAGLRRASSDAEGAFRFEGISNDPGTVYLVGVRVDEVPYGARAVFAEGERELEVTLEVAEPDADTSPARAIERIVRIDAGCEGLFVTETHVLENPTGRALYVPAAARAGREPIFRQELPAAAGEIVTTLGTPPLGLEREAATLRFWGPLYPGRQELEFGYALPAPAAAAGAELAWSFPDGAPRTVVLTDPDSPAPRGAGLAPAGEREVAGRPLRASAAGPFAPGSRLALSLETSASGPPAVELAEARVWLEVDDAALVVDQQIVVRAAEGRPAARGGAPLLCLPLPDGAEDLRFSPDSLALGLAPDASGGLALRGPLPAGESALSLRFHLPLGGGEPVFQQRFPVSLPLLSVFVADTGVLVDAPRLHRRRPVRTGDRGFHHLEGFGIGPDEAVEIRFSRLPATRALPRTATAGLALLVAAATLAFLTGPLRGGPEATPMDPRAEGLAAERQGVYAAIRDLDEDLETGKLTAEDHERLRAELRARAVRLLQQERALASTRASEPGPATCAACARELPPAARFCPGCGVALHERPG